MVDHIGGNMLFRSPSFLVNIRGRLGLYKTSKRMCMDTIPVVSVSHRLFEVDWSSTDD